jgi:hypothetical protein
MPARPIGETYLERAHRTTDVGRFAAHGGESHARRARDAADRRAAPDDAELVGKLRRELHDRIVANVGRGI